MLRWPQRSTGPRHVAVTISVYDGCGYYSSSDFKNDLRVPQLTRGNVFVCLFLCQSQAQSGPKVGVVRVKRWDNLKVWEKQAYRTRMEVMREILRLKSWASQRWETTQWWQDGGLWETQVCLKTDYTPQPLCLLSTKIYLFWPRDPFTLSCYWVKLHPRRLYNSPKSIPAESRMLRRNLNTIVVASYISCRMVLGGGQMGEGLGPAPGKLPLVLTLSSTCRSPPGRFQQTPDYLKKGSRLEDYRSKVLYWSSRKAAIHVWYVIYY